MSGFRIQVKGAICNSCSAVVLLDDKKEFKTDVEMFAYVEKEIDKHVCKPRPPEASKVA